MENKLRHIDDLLKVSLNQYDDAAVLSGDWLAVEKRLKQRGNRIFMMWFSLTLIALIGGTTLFMQHRSGQVANSNQASPSNTIENTSPPSTEDINVIADQEEPTDKSSENNALLGSDETSEPIQSNNLSDSELPSQVTEVPFEVETPLTLDASSGTVNLFNLDLGFLNGISINSIPVIPAISRDFMGAYLSKVDDALNDMKHDHALTTQDIRKRGFGISHTEIGLSFTPSYADKVVSENSALAGLINRDYYDKVEADEYSSPAYSMGLNVEWHFRNHFFIGTGFGLTQRSEFIRYDYVVNTIPIVVNNRIDDYVVGPTETVSYEGSNSYHFIEIPFTLGYSFDFGQRMSWRNQVDFSYLLLTNRIGKKADYTYLDLRDLADINYFKQSNYAVTIKSGFYLNFKKFVIGAEPIFSTNLNNLTNQDAAIQVKPYSYGLNITTNIKLSR